MEGEAPAEGGGRGRREEEAAAAGGAFSLLRLRGAAAAQGTDRVEARGWVAPPLRGRVVEGRMRALHGRA